MTKKTAVQKVKYRFVPPVAVIQSNEKAIEKAKLEHNVMKRVVRGNTFEEIAREFHLEESEAVQVYRAAIRRWGTDLAETANEARTLDLNRYNAMLLQLHPLVFPEPALELNKITGKYVTVQPDPDLVAMKMMLDIMDKRAKIYGYEAKDKMEEEKHEMLKRLYIGAATNEHGEVDL